MKTCCHTQSNYNFTMSNASALASRVSFTLNARRDARKTWRQSRSWKQSWKSESAAPDCEFDVSSLAINFAIRQTKATSVRRVFTSNSRLLTGYLRRVAVAVAQKVVIKLSLAYIADAQR